MNYTVIGFVRPPHGVYCVVWFAFTLVTQGLSPGETEYIEQRTWSGAVQRALGIISLQNGGAEIQPQVCATPELKLFPRALLLDLISLVLDMLSRIPLGYTGGTVQREVNI